MTRAVGWARDAGFESINLDLIFGAAGESLARLGGDARTRPWRWSRSTSAPTPSPSSPAPPSPATPGAGPTTTTRPTSTSWPTRGCTRPVLDWYEISNWARPGRECRHNQLYWAQGDYRGVGCAAHSHQAGRRWWNVRTPERYLDLIATGRPPVGGEEILDAATRAMEALQLALRTRRRCRRPRPAGGPVLDGLATRAGGRAVLTPRGRLLANDVAMHLRVPEVGAHR